MGSGFRDLKKPPRERYGEFGFGSKILMGGKSNAFSDLGLFGFEPILPGFVFHALFGFQLGRVNFLFLVAIHLFLL